MEIEEYSGKYNEITREVFNRSVSTGENRNIVLSPFSIIMLMGIVADAVDGRTREEILDVIGTDVSYEDFREVLRELQTIFSEGDTLVSANAVCVKEEIRRSVQPGYEDRLGEYGGKLFASRNIVHDVNAWVEENTRGMIRDAADDSVSHMQACLMNAVAFEAGWQKKYEEDDIREGEFRNADGTVSKVQMLESTEQFYIEDGSFIGFLRPYEGMEFSYMALLPKEGGAAFMEHALGNIDFTGLFREAVYGKVYATMPEFRYDFSTELTDLCRELGIETLFSPEADFSPMSSEWLKIESILHKAHIEVDRKGTKAEAVTMAIAVACCAPVMEEGKTVCLDRPFLYAIMHNETRLPVFVGVMNQFVPK